MAFDHRFVEPDNIDIVTSENFELVVRRLGAEAIGLTWKHPAHGDIGVLWRNGSLDDPSQFWKSHAPILFPIVGGIHELKSATTDGAPIWFKKQHGFVRHSQVRLGGAMDYGDHFALTYRLRANKETLAMYPWRFALTISYELWADKLVQRLTVSNEDTKPMPFQLGWHPGFAAPLVAGEKAACHLRLPGETITQLLNDDRCYLTGESKQIEARGDFAFTETELDRTYMFDLSALPPEQRAVELLDPDEKVGVRLRFADYPHLGLWSDANAPFICLEAWQGMDDAVEQEPFDKKYGMVMLPPGKNDTREATVELIG